MIEEEFARIKKGVTPYSGKKVRVLERKTLKNGKVQVIVSIGEQAVFGTYAANPRTYYDYELEPIKKKGIKNEND